MPASSPRGGNVDPVFERCPLCDLEGPRIAVYRHLDGEHPDVDSDDFFSNPQSAIT